MIIPVATYPQLRQLCWNRRADAVLDGPEALALYERNWRFVDQDALAPHEITLIHNLAQRYGHGVLMAA